jgi:uncharacterized damage-inducible protein DinB
MISVEKSLRQMAWADEKLFTYLLTLPDQAWRSRFLESEWPVHAYVFHLIASADWYAFTLGAELNFTKESDSIDEIRDLGQTWKSINTFLINESTKGDERLSYQEKGKSHEILRSTALCQAIIHSVEHRAHIAMALKVQGYEMPDLQDFTFWGYEHSLS